jgi:DNA-directed RNA polymerase subunit H (RpoH/RPB5)
MAGKVLDMNSHADWVEGKWEKFKNVSKEWMKDVFDTVKMKTVDKWRFMSERKATNKLIGHKEEDIRNLGYMEENERRNIQTFESGRSSDLEKFNSALESIKDPHIQEIFARNRDEKVSGWDAKIETSNDAIDSVETRKIQYASEIVNFRKDIDEAGEDFSGKIDSRIDHIREKCGYDEKKDQLATLNEEIEVGYDSLKTTKDKIAEYNDALDVAEKIGVSPADLRTLENGIDELESDRELIEHQIDQALLREEKLKKSIAKIDKTTAKWEKMRKKMKLTKDSSVAGNSEQEAQEDDEVLDDDHATHEELPEEENSDEVVSTDDSDSGEVIDNDSDTEGGDEEGDVEEDAAQQRENDDNEEGEQESDDNESNAEDAEAKANKEAIAALLGKTFEKLYKNVNSKEKTAVEIVDEVLEVGKAVEYYRYAFTEKEYTALSKGVLQIKNLYDHAEIEIAGNAIAEQIKKDVFNKVLRKLPDWINI